MPEPPSERQDPRIVRTREHALKAALEIVAESGVQGCTFETVSERSGISRTTLYRHWENKSELVADALQASNVDHAAPDTGSLRDDMLAAMLQLGKALQQTTWGAMVPQLLAAASIDDDMARVQRAASDHHVSVDAKIIKRAIKRGEVADDTDPEHAALLFAAPIFYRHLIWKKTATARWITGHVDKTVSLLTAR